MDSDNSLFLQPVLYPGKPADGAIQSGHDFGKDHTAQYWRNSLNEPNIALYPKLESARDDKKRSDELGKIIQHPIRVRILGILRHSVPCTQRELGRQLSMSSAAIHHHLKRLLEANLVRLQGTRPGPNSITEKLYELNHEEWTAFARASEEKNADVDFYLQYVLAWIQERNREGLGILKEKGFAHPFIVGSYVAKVSYEEIVELKRKVHQLLTDFHDQHRDANDPSEQAFSVMFSILPSREEEAEQSQNVLEFEPDRAEPVV
jgi:DNA-binding transcriptional ArsR family regulator